MPGQSSRIEEAPPGVVHHRLTPLKVTSGVCTCPEGASACLSGPGMLACPSDRLKDRETTMSDNPLLKLSSLGQSVWLDLIRRNMLIPGGEMQKLIEKDGVRGVTSNPAIFEKAINGSSDYDNEIRTLGKQGKNTTEIYECLAIDDVGRAADF